MVRRYKNPLNKRFLREFKEDFAKYLVIFLMMTATIGLVSGILVAQDSMIAAYDESFEKYNIEDGYFTAKKELSTYQRSQIESTGVTVYENYFYDLETDTGSTMRVFKNRTDVDGVCLMKGDFPASSDEIAIDRMYADNNGYAAGDTITVNERTYTISGLVALSDYSALFSDNSDMMFDAKEFGVAIVTDEEFASYDEDFIKYRYAWTYDNKPVTEEEKSDAASDLVEKISDVTSLEDFVATYENQAIIFTGDDLGGDRTMMAVLLYIVIAILAFVFAVTISSTISKEASVIGTLRATGYSKGELVRHYMVVPLLVCLISAVAGNVFGYTLFKEFGASMYYGSYSLTTYETRFNANVFLETTIIPMIIMAVICFVRLSHKLRFSPLKFLRHDLRGRKMKRTLKLNKHIRFFDRFRIRVIFQNAGNYFVLFLGIMFATILLMFGFVFPVLLQNYSDTIADKMITDYQYFLKLPAGITEGDMWPEDLAELMLFQEKTETDNDDAEKFTGYTLKTLGENGFISEEIIIYGVENDSEYILPAPEKGEVYVSSGYALKYGFKEGDTVTLSDPYENKTYDFTITKVYDYEGGMCLFLPFNEVNEMFDLGSGTFAGYFSATPITDIDESYIGTVIDSDSMTKVSRQLLISFGQLAWMLDIFCVIMNIVLIYLLSKVIIEKNAQNISMTKILGFYPGEINKLYITPTTILVIIFMLVSMPVSTYLLEFLVKYIFRQMSGYISFYMDNTLYIKAFALCIATYAVVAFMQRRAINRVPMEEALKNVE